MIIYLLPRFCVCQGRLGTLTFGFFSFSKNGQNGADIWLSIVGEVYDVTKGRDFYGPGSAYSLFSGKDATVAYVTGKFTEEEAAKGLDSLSDAQLQVADQWREFYVSEEKYPFVGRFVDPRYYDSDGNPTTAMKEYQERLAKSQQTQ